MRILGRVIAFVIGFVFFYLSGPIGSLAGMFIMLTAAGVGRPRSRGADEAPDSSNPQDV